MFKRRTLFVLGAGASFEAGLPLGKDLAVKIGQKWIFVLRTSAYNQPVREISHCTGRSPTACVKAEMSFRKPAWLIRDGIGFAQSIDDFLDQHRSNKWVNLYGKAAIAKTILEAEKESRFYFDPFKGQKILDVSSITNTWFVKFMYILGRGVPTEDVQTIFDNVAFIVFNYDRCLEFFLIHALSRLYSLHQGQAELIVTKNLRIVRPYGMVPGTIIFGHTDTDCTRVIDHIKTYTEQMNAADVINAIAAEVERAQCIVFLGFAYHSQNINLLRPARRIAPRQIFGTAFGMSEADVEVVSHDLASFFDPVMDTHTRARMVRLENKLKCAELFDNYAKSLTGGD
jgi:hypothetical protein